MTNRKGHTKINSFDRMAPVVLFLSSYMPLFGIIIIRQLWANTEHLIWGGLCIDGIINLLHYFGVSVVCTIFFDRI